VYAPDAILIADAIAVINLSAKNQSDGAKRRVAG
jgi:hypothetical protein